MASKINIDNIVKAIRGAKNSDINFDIAVENVRSKSDKKTDNAFSSTSEHFLPLFLVIAAEYYYLVSSKDSIKTDSILDLCKFRTVLLNLWFKETSPETLANIYSGEGIESEEKASKRIALLPKSARTLFDRFPMDNTKGSFFSRNNIIMNDTSGEHANAFAVTNADQIPPGNILIKLTDGQIHLRMGIATHDQVRKICIIRIAEKKAN